ADILELPLPRVRVRSPDVGGGFGSKLGLHPEDVVVSIASMRICKPVKWVETRTENLLGTGHGRGQKQFVEVAISEVGKIIGLRVKIIHDAGAYSNGSIGVAANTYMMATGAYDISNYSAEIVSVLTNKVPQSPYRGAGRPEASYLIERAINIMTHKYKLDPVKIRQINFIPIEKFPYKSASGLTYDSGDYGKSLRKALLVSNYEQLKREQARALEEGRLIGIGLSSWVEITGFSPNFPQTASITVTATGDVIVAAGGLTNGQGHATTFTQIVGNELGLDPRNIFVFQGDTDMLPWSSVTGGSRSGALTGSAVLLATRKIKAKMSKIAAQVLGVDRDDFLFEGGKIRDRIDTSKSIEFTNIASIAYKPLSLPIGLEPTLFEYAAFAPPNNAFTFGTHISMIEVDKESGVIKLLKYIAVDDCGNILNPMVVEGQAVGGIVQGIGQAIMEEVVYDESGQLLTSTLADYTLPSSQSLPQISWDKTLTPTNSNPLGVKGIGEAGTTAGTPTVVNAVENALSQRDPELVIDCMPLKPEYIVKLMKEIVSRRISS
ncbi:MAG: molybdopterin-dependent oxidoreductase, partial [Nitrososphaerota archaeon]|nr:molybdopterin-dependent oxidoreductase [Nitrososphaerota archaeon]